MAKAVATCRCKTCGTEFRKVVFKSTRSEADSWEAWAAENYNECETCRETRIQKERAEQNSRNAQAVKELGLPELKGSEKQIAWANTIRMEWMKKYNNFIDKAIAAGKSAKAIDTIRDFGSWVMAKTEAKFWIDNVYTFQRDFRTSWIELKDTYMAAKMEADLESEKEEVATETIEPAENKGVCCEIKAEDRAVEVKSDYHKDIVAIVKAAGYKWDGRVWRREFSSLEGSQNDRAAEIGNKLLCAGFPIRIDSSLKDKAVNGTYEPIHRRWITEDGDHLAIHTEDDVEIQKEARKLPGAARFGNPIKIGLAAYEEVLEFARLKDFRITAKAQAMIDAYKASVTKVDVVHAEEKAYNEKSTRDILNSSRDILEDLKEED